MLWVSYLKGTAKTKTGAFAGPEITLQPKGDRNICLTLEENHGSTNSETLHQLLNGPSCVLSTSVQITVQELWSGLQLWLALSDSRVCSLSINGEQAERSIVPCLFGWAGTSKSCSTFGLYESDALALMMPSLGSAPPWERGEDEPFELYVKSFGQDDSLARHLIEQIKAWRTADRSSSNGLHVRAFPIEYSYVAAQNETVIDKRSTRLVLNWEKNN